MSSKIRILNVYNRKAISIAIISLFILSIFLISLVPSTFASPGVSIEEVGDGEVTRMGNVFKLYVKDGSKDWAAVDIEVDIPIEDITELSFREMIESYSPKGWDVNVVLGVDTDNDGVFEADVPGWHVPPPGHDPAKLGGDSFVEMDGAEGPNPAKGKWYNINALTTARWWTPNSAGDGFASFYGDFTSFLAWLDTVNDDSRIDKGDRVKLVKLVIGGSGSWMNEVAYVKDLSVNGITYDFLLEEIKNEIEAIEAKLDSWFGTGGKFSNTAQATSGSGTTTTDKIIYTGTKVGTVTLSLSTSGISWTESVRVRYYIDPANVGLYIYKTVPRNTIGWTDTAAAWKVEIDITGTGTVNYAYSIIYPP